MLEPVDRSQLHAVIARRFEAMMEAGFADEVRTLLARPGMSEKSHTMRLVGYRQLAAYVAGRDSLPDAVGKAMAATRQLAKRQLTWLRGQNLLPSCASVHRVDPFDDTARNYMSRVLIEGPTRA